MIDSAQQAAIRHFRKHQHKAPNYQANIKGPWKGLSFEEVEQDVQTADWVPNRAMWRAKGLKGRRHALEVL